LRGSLAEVTTQAGQFGDDYLRVELEEKARTGLADEVRDLFPGAVEVRLADGEERDSGQVSPRRLGRDPAELFAEYLTSRNVEDPALVALFDELLAESHET
jgi:exonuclease SbcD